jgi:hypothetical protein
MKDNPHTSALNRWFQLATGALGSAASLTIVITSLVSRRAPGLTRRTVYQSWTAADNPTQYWFSIGFWIIVSLVMSRIAWKAYREWDA